MKIIGVTGGTGSGKSTLCKLLSGFGAEVIDADEIARSITKKGGKAYPEILSYFKKGILYPDGEINRKALAEIVFSDKKSLDALNDITHKHVFSEMKRRMTESKAEVVVLDVPLLFSSKFPFKCDLTVGVTADKEERIKRIMLRDGLSREEILKRMENQITDKELFDKADVTVLNDSPNSLKAAAERLISRIRNE